MIIDIGGGTTEVALISLSGIVFSRIRVAGDELDEAIMNYMKRAYNLMIGERTAEEIKIKIGSAYPIEKETTMEVKGRDLVAGLPKTLTITSQEVREALLEPINASSTPSASPSSAALPSSPPIWWTAASSWQAAARCSAGSTLLTEETGLPVHVAEDPLSAVAEGTGRALNELKFLRQVATWTASGTIKKIRNSDLPSNPLCAKSTPSPLPSSWWPSWCCLPLPLAIPR